MARRKNTFTRFFEDIIDDTKDLVDDLIDRAKDVEEDVKDAAKNVVDDDEDGASDADMKALRAQLSALQSKIEELTALQAAATKPAAAKA